jgi:hypothetical protein
VTRRLARRDRFLFALFAVSLVLGACTPEGQEAPGRAASPAAATAESLRFDPATIRPGDRVGELEVVSVDVSVAQGTGTYVGSVRFAGELHLRGVPIVLEMEGPVLHCFNVDEEHALRVPRMRHDERRAWFCFDNQEEAAARLGTLLRQPVEVVVRDYHTVYEFTDAHDSAHLEDVLPRG